MSLSNGIDLKPVVDEATPVVQKTEIMINELGFFHTASNTQIAGAKSQPPVSKLPSAKLGDFLTRRTLIASGSLLTTDTPLNSVAVIDPWALYLANTVIANKTDDYKLIRAGMRVFISIVAPPGTYGFYVANAVPNGTLDVGAAGGVSSGSADTQLQYPHIFIDPATSTDGELKLPWIHWNDYAVIGDTTTSEGCTGMWYIRMQCMQALKSGMGDDTPTATYRIWACLEDDYDLVIPYNQMGDFNEMRQQVNSTTENAVGMKPSGIAGAVATGAGALGAAVPFLAPLAAPISAAASVIGSVLSFFGFTRSTDQQTPTIVTKRPYSNVANMDCDDTSEIAALSSTNMISYDPKIVSWTSEDQSSFNYLLQKWTLVGVQPWTLADAAGDMLVTFPVTPYLSRLGMTSGYRPTMGGYLGFPMQKWRCTMEYMIYVPFSKFHRGALQISWSPDSSVVAADITNLRYNHVIDLGTGSIWIFSVGFAHHRAMLENIPHLFDAAIVTTSGANGLVSINVTNPLKAQQETATTNIFIFARCGCDFQVGVPRNSFYPLNDDGTLGTLRDFHTGFTLQSGALGDDIPVTQKFTLVPSTVYPVKEVLIGENVDSVRALCQKFSPDLNITRNVYPYNRRYVFNHLPSMPSTVQSGNITPHESYSNPQYFNYFGYYTAMFIGVACSMRYKILNSGGAPQPLGISNANTSVGIDMTTAVMQSHISNISPMWEPTTGEGIEITVPYYHDRKYIQTFRYYDVDTIVAGTSPGRVNVIDIPAYEEDSTDLYQTVVGYSAAGPDIRFHLFRVQPTIVMATANSDGMWSMDRTPPG